MRFVGSNVKWRLKPQTCSRRGMTLCGALGWPGAAAVMCTLVYMKLGGLNSRFCARAAE